MTILLRASNRSVADTFNPIFFGVFAEEAPQEVVPQEVAADVDLRDLTINGSTGHTWSIEVPRS